MNSEIAVLLPDVRSAHNVGSIFRTADAAGVAKIYLSGYTPTPIDRFNRAQPDIAKTALGAELTVPWEYCASSLDLITRLREDGWQIVGVEQDVRSIDYREHHIEKPTVYVFGNEVDGISSDIRDACDSLIEIPMRGTKESLNVSVAAGVVLFSLKQ